MPAASVVGIIYKHQYYPARTEAENLKKWFQSRETEVYLEEIGYTESPYGCSEEPTTIPETVDWVVVLGGDGTMLGAARRIGRYGIPMLGVNLGGLGFLTGIPLDRLYPEVERMVRGELEYENRMMLEVEVLRDGEVVCRFQVLNDAVINKPTLARIIDLDVSINQEFLTTFRADGLIISTPTGSTAYNLAANGPILCPTMETLTLTPICPFTLTNRPIIISDKDRIHIGMGRESAEGVILTFDGQMGFELCYGDRVRIFKSQERIVLLRPPEYSYFKVLRNKLMWGGTTYNRDENH